MQSSIRHAANHLLAGKVVQFDLDFGREIVERIQRAGKQFNRERWRIAYVDLAMVTVRGGASDPDGFFGASQHSASFGQERRSCGGELDATRTALEQFQTEFSLQIVNLAAERGLGDAKPARGFGEIQKLADRRKISQMPQFHRASKSVVVRFVESETVFRFNWL